MHLTVPRAARGFSLIELIIVLLIVSILLLIGLPNFRVWIANSRMRSTAEALENDLRLAEQTAVATSHQTALVLSNTEATAAAVGTNSVGAAGAGAPALYWYVQQTPATYDISQAPVMLSASSTGQTGGVQVVALQAPAGTTNGTGVAEVCFSSLGRQVSNTPASSPLPTTCTAIDTRFVISMPASAGLSGYRPLWVTADQGGRIRTCDPSVSVAVQPYGC